MIPAFIGIGGRMDPTALKTEEVVETMLVLMLEPAAPSLSLRSKIAWSPSIVRRTRKVTGSSVQ